jgi:hypothetical protein
MARQRIGSVAKGTENEVAVTVLTGDTSDKTRILLTDGDGEPLGIHTRDQARDLRRFLDMSIARSVGTAEGDPLDGWDLTTQGYVRGPWRIYHAETWCVALRADCERMVSRLHESAEAAVAWVKQAAGQVTS